MDKIVIYGIFLGLISIAHFILSYFGFIGSPVIHVVSALSVLLGLSYFMGKFVLESPKKDLAGKSIFAANLFFIVVNLTLCFLPAIQKDELNHHLAFPKLYLESGKILEIDQAPYSFYPMLVQMLYTSWLGIGFESGAKLTHFLYALMTGLLLFEYLNRRLGKVYGSLAQLIFISVPIIQKLSHTAYVDLGLIFYSTASLFCLLEYKSNYQVRRWLVLAGLSCGLALCSKPNGMLLAFPLGLILVSILHKQGDRSVKQRLFSLGVFLLLALVCVSPWYVKNTLVKANPFYPQFESVFNPQREGNVYDTSEELSNPFVLRSLMYGESTLEIALLPIRVFLYGEDNNPRRFDGMMSPILILFLFWAFKSSRNTDKQYLVFYTFLYFALAFLLSGVRVRYLSPAIPGLVVLTVFGIEFLIRETKLAKLAMLLVSAAVSWHTVYILSTASKLEAVPYLLGEMSNKEYLARRVGSYPAMTFANDSLAVGSKVYLALVGRQTYYLDRDFYFDTDEVPKYLLSVIKSSRNGEQILDGLRKYGISHLIVRDGLLSRYLRDNLNAEQIAVWGDFATKYAKLLFTAKDHSLISVGDA